MAVTSVPPARHGKPGPSRPPRWPGRLAPTTTPSRLRLLMVGLAALAVAWGVVGAWTVSQHASAAGNVVSTSEPLSLDAQRMYQSLSDADVTATTAFVAGPDEPLAARQRFDSDIAQAAVDLTDLRNAATARGDQQLDASLAAISAGLPVYTADVAEAESENAMGFGLTGGSFIQVASEEMHLTLLPAARASYQQENAQLTAASSAATGLPWIVVVAALALITGYVLFRAQRWLGRHTHRVVNYGLLLASLALVVGLLWLVIAFLVARSDLQRGVGHGAAPAETLAQASIDVQQARGDEVLNLISRSGDTSFEQNFVVVRGELGPGPGTLLTSAAASSQGAAAEQPVASATQQATAWYAVNEQVYRLGDAANYAGETRLVIGTGSGSSSAGFRQLETDLSQGMAADQVIFQSSAAAVSGAFGGLEAAIIVVALLMAAGCVWGLNRRLAEYR
jgi:hypothetical protein